MIYFIRAGADGPVKIGYAASVARRVAFIQAGNHHRLTLLRTLPGGRQTEAWLHRRFATARVDREWFAFDAEMLTIEPPTETARSARSVGPALPDNPIRNVVQRLGGIRATARIVGVPVSTAQHWYEQGSMRSPRIAAVISKARAAGIELTPADFFQEAVA